MFRKETGQCTHVKDLPLNHQSFKIVFICILCWDCLPCCFSSPLLGSWRVILKDSNVSEGLLSCKDLSDPLSVWWKKYHQIWLDLEHHWTVWKFITSFCSLQSIKSKWNGLLRWKKITSMLNQFLHCDEIMNFEVYEIVKQKRGIKGKGMMIMPFWLEGAEIREKDLAKMEGILLFCPPLRKMKNSICIAAAHHNSIAVELCCSHCVCLCMCIHVFVCARLCVSVFSMELTSLVS